MTTSFDRRIESLNRLGSRWAAHLVDVIDTAEAVRLGIEQWNGTREPSDELLLGLTGMVLAREAEARDRLDREARLGRSGGGKP